MDFRFVFRLKYEKTKNGKTKIDFRFIVFRFKYEKTKNGKTKIDFRFIVFRFNYDQSIGKNKI